ncbi:MAG: LuxR C-terminal-related transcriptional regulator [Coriobacteriales bacterium]|jgi:LuxR family maltose regulon positive regulatory protein|nr:LuxR C-terminal-related transcriptional regulator [Coriobacteriales bacterium]
MPPRKPLLLKGKSVVPSPPADALWRAELAARLTRASHDVRATLLVAPAGFGKTTLVSQWALRQTQGRPSRDPCDRSCPPVAWLGLDAADNDPERFLAYLSKAVLGRSSPDMDALIGALEGGLEPEDGRSTTGPRHILVLDDCQLLEEGSGAHGLLAYLVAHQPKGLHLLLLSRASLHLGLTRLLMEGQLHLLTSEDLRFSPDEVVAVFGLAHRHLALPRAQRIREFTGGWPAAVRLLEVFDDPAAPAAPAAASAVPHTAGQDPADGDAWLPQSLLHAIADYTSEEVFRQVSAQERDFLLATGLLDVFCADLAQELTGLDRTDVARILDRLVDAQVFLETIPKAHGDPWYSYRQPFSLALRHSAQRSAQVQQRPLLEKASLWYECNGNHNLAVRCAQRIRDFARIAHIMCAHWREMFAEDHLFMFYSWASMLPDEMLVGNPQVASLVSLAARICEDTALSALCADVARRHYVDPGQPFYAEALTLRAQLGTLVRDPGQAQEDARTALALLPLDDYYLRAAATQALLLAPVVPDWLQYRDAMLEFLPEVMAHGKRGYVANHYAFLAAAEGYLGNFRSSQAYGEKAMAVERSLNPLRPTFMNLYIARVNAAYHRSALGEAELHRKLYQDVSREGFAARELSSAIAFDALFHYLRGDREQACELAAQAVSLTPYGLLTKPLPTGFLRCLQEGGTLDVAAFLADTAAEYGESLFWRRLALSWGVLQGDDGCLSGLRALVAEVEPARRIDAVHARLLLCIAEEQAGNSAAAEDALLEALSLAQPEQMTQLFVNEHCALLPVLDRLMRESMRECPPGLRDFCQLLFSQLSRIAQGDMGMAQGEAPSTLTTRESDIAYLLISGYRSADIAERLGISRQTVRKHIANLYAKLSVHSRAQLILYFQSGFPSTASAPSFSPPSSSPAQSSTSNHS